MPPYIYQQAAAHLKDTPTFVGRLRWVVQPHPALLHTANNLFIFFFWKERVGWRLKQSYRQNQVCRTAESGVISLPQGSTAQWDRESFMHTGRHSKHAHTSLRKPSSPLPSHLSVPAFAVTDLLVPSAQTLLQRFAALDYKWWGELSFLMVKFLVMVTPQGLQKANIWLASLSVMKPKSLARKRSTVLHLSSSLLSIQHKGTWWYTGDTIS